MSEAMRYSVRDANGDELYASNVWSHAAQYLRLWGGAGKVWVSEFYYVYGAPNRADGLRFFLQHSERKGWAIGWSDEADCQRYVDTMRADGERVEVMPSAVGPVA